MRAVLADIEATDVPEIIVVNKADAADPEVLDRLRRHEKDVVIVSARTGEGLDALRAVIDETLPRPLIPLTVLLPYQRGDLVNRLHTEADVISEEHRGDGTLLEVKVSDDLVEPLSEFRVVTPVPTDDSTPDSATL